MTTTQLGRSALATQTQPGMNVLLGNGSKSISDHKPHQAPGFVISNAKLLRKNSLIGSFDLEMPSGLVVRGAMLFEKDGRRWVNFPSKEWTNADGAKQYFPLLEFASKEIKNRFQNQVVPLAEEALLGGTVPARQDSKPEPSRPSPAPKQEAQRGHWSGPQSGPNDDLPF